MVARKTSAELHGRSPIKQAFDGWRRALRHAQRGAETGAEMAADDLNSLREGSGAPLQRPWVILIGIACLALGALARTFYPAGPVTAESLLFGVGVIGWAIVRRLILGYLAGSRGGEPISINAAWSLGLMPLATSFNAAASAAAWLVSGAVTSVALGFFVPRKRALLLVGATWLIQLALYAAAVIVYWLALNLLVALFA